MDLTAFKSPLVIGALIGSVCITNVITYNVAAPAASDQAKIEALTGEIEQLQADLKAQQERYEKELEDFLKPAEGLNPARKGGLNWNGSIRE